MSIRVLHLRNLSQRERHVLMLMRAAAAPGYPATADAFAALARNAASAGLSIAAATSPIVHCDEKKLLAWLTLLQRQKFDESLACDLDIFDKGLLVALRDAAVLLGDAGIRLDYRNAVRFLQGAGICHDWHEPAASDASPLSARGPAARASCAPSLRSRVLRFVAEKGAVATHDLHAFGVSRHLIGVLRKQGELRRVRHGVYAVSRADRPLSAVTGR